MDDSFAACIHKIRKEKRIIMKYLKQFLIILVISLIGELLNKLLPLPVPASIYGMVILFIGLLSGVIKLSSVKEAGSFLASIAKTHYASGRKLAYIAGGETVVNLTGHGKGGRNQEIALSAAAGIDGMDNVVVFSIGSDGTDGPTDAAGGYSDGRTAAVLRNKGIDIFDVLKDNDAYNALKETDGLIITGPTGTNVNDVAVLLIG